MSNYSTGHQAEKAAAMYLSEHGYEISELNWKTPICEIDIVALKDSVVYFVEVKYRKNNFQGSGFDYITSKSYSRWILQPKIGLLVIIMKGVMNSVRLRCLQISSKTIYS